MFSSSTTRVDSRRLTAARRALCALALTVAAPPLMTANAEAAQPIPGQYIVTVEKGHDPQAVAGKLGAKPRHVYDSALNGFAAKLNDQQVAALRHNPNVVRIEQDQLVSARQTQTQSSPPWGIDRIDQVQTLLSGTYSWNNAGAGVRAYILDTGIATSHPDFEGRAANAYDATGNGYSDCVGHGTHVAGTVGSRTFGVAKNVLLRSVKVLGECITGTGPNSDIIDGVEWVRENHIKPAVVNMSLGTDSTSASLDEAVESLVLAGVFVSVSAGNEMTDACGQSPARAKLAYTVGATARQQSTDTLFVHTNYGPCVDIFAPGVNIRSTDLGNTNSTKSGTSMAAPHVAGTAALLCSVGASQCQPGSITSWLQTNATNGAISYMPWSNTVNRLLNKRGL